MLPVESRLKITSLTTRSWKDKKEAFTPEFKAVYTKTKNRAKAKIGFIVGGKVGNAVERNRARRILVEVIRKKLDKFPPGLQAIFIASKTGNFSHQRVDNSIDKVLEKMSQPI